jgi:hypothetical protein
MLYLEYKYYTVLKQLVEAAPENFSLHKYLFQVENRNTESKTYIDPYEKKYLENNNIQLSKLSFILKGGSVGDSIIAEFFDIRGSEKILRNRYKKNLQPNKNEYSSPYFFPNTSHNTINEVIFYEKMLTIFSTHYGNPFGMLWLHMWAKQLKLKVSLTNKEYIKGLAFIDGLKIDAGAKIKLLSYSVFDRERYEKILALDEIQWSLVLSPHELENVNEYNNEELKQISASNAPRYLSLKRDSYSSFYRSNYKPSAMILTNDPEILPFIIPLYESTTVWVKPENKKECMGCKMSTSQIEAVKPIHLSVTYFLCKNCKEVEYDKSQSLTSLLSQSPLMEHKIIAAESLYVDKKTLQELAFTNNVNVRNKVFENPNADDVIKTAVKLQI